MVLLALMCATGCGHTSAHRAQAFVASGDRHAAAGDLAAADIEYRNAIKATPSSIEAHSRLLDLSTKRHDGASVAREVFALAELLPDDTGVQMRAGELALQLGHLSEAEQTLKRAVAIDESKAAPHRVLALVYTRWKRLAEAERQWEAVAKSPDGDPFALADFHIAQGRLGQAEGELRDLLDTVPHSDAARMRLARVLHRQGHRAEADRLLEGIVRHDPRNAMPWLLRGQLRLADHQSEAAADAYTEALKTDPTSVDALAALTAIDLDAKRVQTAVTRVERAVIESPESVPVRLLAGRLYESIGDHGKAEQHLTRAIGLEPSNLDAYTLLGQVYIRQARLAEARQQFAHLAEQQPENPSAATMIGMLFEAESRPSDAQAQYEHLLAVSPRAGVAANNLACLYLRNGRLDEALRYALVAKEELPHLPQVSDTLGWIYVQRKQSNDALPLLSDAAERQPESPVYRFHLAVAYADTGALAQARTELAHALSTAGNFPGRDEAVRLKTELDLKPELDHAATSKQP